jgi:hypothetical protein
MKTITVVGLHKATDYNIVARKLPYKFAVIGMPHMRDAFAYLSDSYRDDLPRLKDCNSYHVFTSLRQAIEFIAAPYGHKGAEAASELAEKLECAGVLEVTPS